MKPPYLQSRRHRFWKRVFYFTILLILAFLLTGCVRKPDPVESSADVAHQQIVAIKDSIPKECMTKANEEQLKALDRTIDVIVYNCEAQKDKITSEKLKWMYSFFALLIIVLANIARKVLK